MNGLTRIEWQQWMALDLPEGWVYDEEPDTHIISLYASEDGVGALQISTRPPAGDEPPDERLAQRLEAFVVHCGGRDCITQTTLADDVWVGHAAFTAGDGYWEAWALEGEAGSTFITYNCDLADMGREKATYAQILDSLTLPWTGENHVLRTFAMRLLRPGQYH